MGGILDDFQRGVSEGRIKTDHKKPQAEWLASSKLLSDPALSYNPTSPGEKMILGDAQ
jgi:hypothetical protein